MALSELNVALGLITRNFERGLRDAEKSLGRFERQVSGIGTNLTQSLTAPIVGLGAAALQSFAQFEKASNALTAVTGNAAASADQIERLREVAKLPGLGFQEAVQASARLQAVGLSAEQAEASIAAFGNAVARSGGGRAEFDGAILALTQIASKGKISAEEINQLNERIFEIRPALSAAFGTADSEQLQKLGISAEEFIARTTAELAKLDKVQGGLANSFENLGDSVRNSLADLGNEINKAFDIEGIVNRIGDELSRIVNVFKNLDDETKRNIVRLAAFAAAAGPVLLVTGRLVGVVRGAVGAYSALAGIAQSVVAGFIGIATGTAGPIAGITRLTTAFKALTTAQKVFQVTVAGVAIAAVALLASRFFDLKNRIDDSTNALNAVTNVQRSARAEALKEASAITTLIDKIQNGTISRGDQIKAIENLQAKYPGFLSNIRAEEVSIDNLRKARDELVETIFKSARARAAEGKLVEVNEKLLELQDKQKTAFQELQKAREQAANVGNVSGGQAQGQVLAASQQQQRAAEKNIQAIASELDALFEQEKQLAEFAASNTLVGGVDGGGVDPFGDNFDRAGQSADKIADILKKVQSELLAVNERAKISGDTFDVATAKVEVLADAVEDLISAGAGAESTAVQGLIEQIDTLRGSIAAVPTIPALDTLPAQLQSVKAAVDPAAAALEQARANAATWTEQINSEDAVALDLLRQQAESLGLKVNELGQFIPDTAGIIGDAAGAIGTAIGDSFGEGIEGVKAFATAFANAARSVIKALIAEGVTAIVANTLKGPTGALGPLALPIAAAAGAAAAGLFSAIIPQFAEGGVVTSATLGIFGEAGPEAVIPLDRLESMMGNAGGAQRVEVYGRLSGTDIFIASERGARELGRIR